MYKLKSVPISNHHNWKIIILSLLIVIAACGYKETTGKHPKVKVKNSVLSKGVDNSGANGFPLEQTSDFSILDDEVVSFVRINNLSGTHTLRWEWYKPDNTVYFSTNETSLNSGKDKYCKETTAWHKISVRGEEAAVYPGKWKVNIYFDDKKIVSDKFIINDLNVDKVPQYSQKLDANKWAIVIGIENYSSLPKVDYAKNDALMFKKYFTKVLGVPEKNLICLIDSQATKGVIEGYLRSYLPTNLDKDATLYLYFSGHGSPSIKENDAYLVPFDGNPQFIEHTGYKLNTLYKDLDGLNVKRVILFIDSCFSGAEARGQNMLISGARPALIHVKKIKMTSQKVVSLSASTGKQISNAYPEKKHGLFSYYLLKGLRGAADLDKNDKVSIQELHNYSKANVDLVSRRMGLVQTPVILPVSDAAKNITITTVIR